MKLKLAKLLVTWASDLVKLAHDRVYFLEHGETVRQTAEKVADKFFTELGLANKSPLDTFVNKSKKSGGIN